MRTAKKSSQGKTKKTKTKAKAKTSKAVAKAKPRAAAKARATAQSKKRAVKSKAKAAPKTKAKAAPKTKARPKAKASAKKTARSTVRARKPPPRRDATGHLDPKYARDLRALSQENRDESDDRAFFKTPRSGDDLAEELGEQAVGAMTSGEDQSERLSGEVVEEERGGPFVKTRSGEEFAGGTDRSNPRDATREPFPRT